MECKNCLYQIIADENYCTRCGARVIKNRLTLKNVLQDIYEQHLNLDNRLLATLVHLFTKPEDVIKGYLSGLRKRYLNPISYLGLAITLSGILVFVIKRYFLKRLNLDVLPTGANIKGANKIFETTLDYQNFVFVFLIPLMASIGWLVYTKPRYNFTEHLVNMTYVLAHLTIVTFPIAILLLYLDPEHFGEHGFVNIALIIIYTVYVYRKICDYTLKTFFARTTLFIILFVLCYFLFSLGIVILMLLTGTISIEDIRPS